MHSAKVMGGNFAFINATEDSGHQKGSRDEKIKTKTKHGVSWLNVWDTLSSTSCEQLSQPGSIQNERYNPQAWRIYCRLLYQNSISVLSLNL